MAEQPEKSKTLPGVITLQSHHSAAATLERLENLVQSKGLKVFAKIDFAADATQAGMAMPAMVQLVFGNPKAGTPLLVAAPTVGLELPLKVLIWQDSAGDVWLSYADPEALAQRHQVPAPLVPNIAGIRTLAEQAVSA